MVAGISRYFYGSMDIFRLIAIATLFLLFAGQVEAVVRDMYNTSALEVFPIFWPQDTDPYHNHSGHILQREGSVLYDELDLLNTLTPSTQNSDIQLSGTLYPSTSKNPKTVLGLSSIILIDCDSSGAESDFLQAARGKAKAVIFYTTEGNCCGFESSAWGPISPDGLLIFTFANMKSFTPPQIDFYLTRRSTNINIVHRSQMEDDSLVQDPIGEPPVKDLERTEKGSAMLIVYIIVALISAGFIFVMLFLGIKAYRRYGNEPTQHLRARPRQSRARGIAKAALDTLPVVKFGSRPLEAAPKDLEMQDGASSLGARESTHELGLVNVGQTAPASVAPGSELQTSPPTATTPLPTEPPPAYTPVSRGIETPGATEPDPNQVRCPVCLDDFEEDQEVRVLPCSHSFHTDCIDPWLLNVAGSCPLCRIDLRSPEERARDNLTTTLPPPPPTLTTRPRSSSVRSGRLQAMLDVARSNSSREERLAALRAVRDEGVSGRVPRSRRPELGVSRLRRAVFGSGTSEGNGGGEGTATRDISQRVEDNTGLAEAGAAPGIHSRSSSTGSPR